MSTLIIEDLLVDMYNKKGWAVIYPDDDDDEKYAELEIKFDYKFEYTQKMSNILTGGNVLSLPKSISLILNSANVA